MHRQDSIAIPCCHHAGYHSINPTVTAIPSRTTNTALRNYPECVLCGTQFGHAYYTRRMTVRSRCRYIILSTAEFFISCQDDKTGGISTRVRLFNLRGRIRIGMRWIRACPMGTPGAFHYYILHHTLYNTEDIRDTDT